MAPPDEAKEGLTEAGDPGTPEYRVSELTPSNRSFFVVIPVINEADRILRQLAAIRDAQIPAWVVLADGGSTDGSTDQNRLRELGVNTLLVKTGPGRLSAQLRMGFDYALRMGAQGVVTVDGNGKDDVAGTAGILRALAAGADFVQGSRFVPGGVAENTPWTRNLAIRAIHAPTTSLAARRRFTDTTNGFRGHSRKLLLDPRVAPFRSVFNTYELLAYLPIRSGQLNLITAEVPVRRSYPGDGAVPTKIHGVRANAELLQILGRAATGRYDPSDPEIAAARIRAGSRYCEEGPGQGVPG